MDWTLIEELGRRCSVLQSGREWFVGRSVIYIFMQVSMQLEAGGPMTASASPWKYPISCRSGKLVDKKQILILVRAPMLRLTPLGYILPYPCMDPWFDLKPETKIWAYQRQAMHLGSTCSFGSKRLMRLPAIEGYKVNFPFNLARRFHKDVSLMPIREYHSQCYMVLFGGSLSVPGKCTGCIEQEPIQE